MKAKGAIFAIVFDDSSRVSDTHKTIGAIIQTLSPLDLEDSPPGRGYEERGPAVSAEAKEVRAREMIRVLRRLG